jgi:DNA modification methylase
MASARRISGSASASRMVRGENILGHSAPFPFAIPELLIRQMEPGQVVLDPYGGSMTTARAAIRQGIRSISIEIHEDYCLPGKRLLESETAQLQMSSSWPEKISPLG